MRVEVATRGVEEGGLDSKRVPETSQCPRDVAGLLSAKVAELF